MLASRFNQSCVHTPPPSRVPAPSSWEISSKIELPDDQTLIIKKMAASGSTDDSSRTNIEIVSEYSDRTDILYTLTVQDPAPEYTSPTQEPNDNSLAFRASRALHILELGPVDHWTESATESDLWMLQYALLALWPEQELIVLTPQVIKQAGLTSLRARILTSGMGIESSGPPNHTDSPSLILLRSSFWQGAGQGALSGTAFAPWVLPNSLHEGGYTRDHTPALVPGLSPARSPLPKPKWEEEGDVYTRYIPHLQQTLSFRLINPHNKQDVATFAKWQDSDRVNDGWRQRGADSQEHLNYLLKQEPDPNTWGLIGYWDGDPWGYIEIYWAKESNIADLYDVRPFDRGFHALVGEEKYRGEHRVRAWMSSVLHLIFLLDPRTDRAVSEPRASNAKMVQYECMNGGHVEKLIDLPHKRSALVLFPRERFFQLCPMAWTPAPPSKQQ
ncbi:hypothetical protein OC846_003565 [Tilletia horrida]|uniref:Acyltransferase MbtK/IucB-like conserved domain-containing protein n=1 Tax=Tilletia horrida TaxID=155126 RepID=A0AAN6GNW3_9BASI|nr:hypothetical protein OC846_003565 [Tilletia horrida]KAK0565967.1 hypothetical protein OC861_003481 [Tilletia horrida]